MIKELYGSFKVKKRSDYLINFLKAIYLMYTLPFLIFGVSYYLITLSSFDESMKLSRVSKIGKILIHVLANMICIMFYVYIYRTINGE
jgi:hypothetical protein